MLNKESVAVEKPELSRTPAAPSRVSSIALLACLAAITMFFAALTSACLIRRGLASDWQSLKLQGPLYGTVLFPLLISGMMELARRRRIAYFAVGALGIGFLCVQWWSWSQIRVTGASPASNPAAAFFFILLAAFGVLVAGGVLALGPAMLRAAENGRSRFSPLAVYWHYLGVLWVYLLIMFWYLN